MYIHTGEKPFKCTHVNCDKSFRQRGKLSVHNKMHQIEDLQTEVRERDETISQLKKKIEELSQVKVSVAGESKQIKQETGEIDQKDTLATVSEGNFLPINHCTAESCSQSTAKESLVNKSSPVLSSSSASWIAATNDFKPSSLIGSVMGNTHNNLNNMMYSNRSVTEASSMIMPGQSIPISWLSALSNTSHNVHGVILPTVQATVIDGRPL